MVVADALRGKRVPNGAQEPEAPDQRGGEEKVAHVPVRHGGPDARPCGWRGRGCDGGGGQVDDRHAGSGQHGRGRFCGDSGWGVNQNDAPPPCPHMGQPPW
jgi:hypothetical protein